MGAAGFDHQDAESVFDEINGLVRNYGGMTFERLRSGGLQWPCLAVDMADTPLLHADDGGGHKLKLVRMTLAEHQPHGDPEYPYLLAKGRVLHQSDRTMEIGKSGKRNQIRRDEVLELHEDDARALGVEAGDWVEAVSAGNTVRGVVQLTSPHKGLIATTALFGQLVSELDASKEPDPMLKVDGLPLVPVRVEKVAEEAAD
jgi:predicted molibdopterin-dependent oxidoreductase YjgC